MDDKKGIDQDPQTEPSEEMGTYGMGPGTDGDEPLTDLELAQRMAMGGLNG